MTAGVERAERTSRRELGSLSSVEHRLRGLAPITVGLLAVLVITEVVHGFRVVGTPWFGGDLLYHQALAHEILRGELRPGGPYPGLPTYYPPGFHLLLAATMAVSGLDAVRADQLLTLVWLPVLPVGTFLLARRVTGRPWVALLATVLTVFGGALDLRAGRTWVNSLFLSGQEAYPLFPRDLVFGILPFAVLAFLRAVEPRGRSGSVLKWSILAGLLFGVAAFIQPQLLLPLPIALVVTAVAIGLRDPARRLPATAAVLVCGGVAALIAAPWLISELDAIRRNGGVAIDSSDTLAAARFGFWSYPREFGLFLPFGLIGAGVALLLHRPNAVAGGAGTEVARRWRPDPVEGMLLITTWWALAFVLGILYSPDWPLEDALRPQRLWLLASQPLAILAAIGLTATVEAFVARRWHRPRLVGPVIAVAVVLACVPTTLATMSLLRSTWTQPTYSVLDLAADHVPDFGALLGDRGAARVVLTYEDWSSLAWYLSGDHVVGLVPAGFAKLAYDPAVFTGRSQAERRSDLARAFSGAPGALAAVADAYGARTIVIARRDGRWGVVDVSTALLAPPTGVKVVEGNGWDGLELSAGSRVQIPFTATGPIDLEIRLVDRGLALPSGAAAPVLSLLAARPNGTVQHLGSVSARLAGGLSTVVSASIALGAGDTLVVSTNATVTIQSVRGFVPAPAISGWRVVRETPDAVVLERAT